MGVSPKKGEKEPRVFLSLSSEGKKEGGEMTRIDDPESRRRVDAGGKKRKQRIIIK